MKQRILINTLLLFGLFLLSANLMAQKIESYVLVMPKHYLAQGGPIYIKTPENKGELQEGFGKRYVENLTQAFNTEGSGLKNGIKMFNPWYTTKLYSVTENEADANYIMSGEYEFKASSSKGAKEHTKKETASKEPKIPYHFYEYYASANASVSGKLELFDKKADKVVLTFPIDEKANGSNSKYLKPADAPSKSTYINMAANKAINKWKYYFIPYYRVHTYNFKNVRPEDKDYRKELRKKRSDFKDYVDNGEIFKLGAAYKEILTHKLKDVEDAHLNMAMCYEIIGNFTKAKEHYEKSKSEDDIKRINILIQYRDIYKSLGVEIIEKDFE